MKELSKIIGVRFSEQDYNTINALAQAEGRTASDYLRRLVNPILEKSGSLTPKEKSIKTNILNIPISQAEYDRLQALTYEQSRTYSEYLRNEVIRLIKNNEDIKPSPRTKRTARISLRISEEDIALMTEYANKKGSSLNKLCRSVLY